MTTRIRAWRRERGWAEQECADLTGYSLSSWSRIERGERKIPPSRRVAVARALGARVADLFEPGGG